MATMSDCIGYVASTLVLMTFMTKDMRHLRVIAIVSNLAFISYGLIAWLPPVLGLHLLLLPLNILRLSEITGKQPIRRHDHDDVAMEDAVARMRSRAERERLDVEPVDRLAATVAQHEDLACTACMDCRRRPRLRRDRPMPPHRKGTAIWDDPGRDAWHPDPEFWSANSAEHRFADACELVAFSPAAHRSPTEIGWELYGGPEFRTLVATGQAPAFEAPRPLTRRHGRTRERTHPVEAAGGAAQVRS